MVGLRWMLVMCMYERCEVGKEADVLIVGYLLYMLGILLVGVCVDSSNDCGFGCGG